MTYKIPKSDFQQSKESPGKTLGDRIIKDSKKSRFNNDKDQTNIRNKISPVAYSLLTPKNGLKLNQSRALANKSNKRRNQYEPISSEKKKKVLIPSTISNQNITPTKIMYGTCDSSTPFQMPLNKAEKLILSNSSTNELSPSSPNILQSKEYERMSSSK